MSDVVVVGAGSVGTAVALDLVRRGAEVTVLERGPAVAAGCSAGNAGVVGAAHVLPLASAQSVREGLTSLVHDEAPFSIRPRPELVPWLARFVAAARPAAHARAAGLLRELASRSARMHAALGSELDVGYVREGFLSVYVEPEELRAARDQDGASGTQVVDAAGLPWLGRPVAGALLHPNDAHVDPVRFVHALAGEVTRLGGRVQTGVEVVGVRMRAGRVTGVSTTTGELACDALVLATGAWSPELSRALGVRLPVQGGKGYAIEYAGSAGFRQPVYFPSRRIVLTPLRDRVRLTGMLELCGTDLSVDARRVVALRRQGEELVPTLADLTTGGVWRGLRPCTPDGLPIVGGLPGTENGWLATGHGMWGLQLAPITGALLGAAITGSVADHNLLAPLSATRFSAFAPAQSGSAARSSTLASRLASNRVSGSARSIP